MILTLLGCAWLGWIALNIAALVAAPLIAGERAGVFTNGLQIVIPAAVADALTRDELAAVISHERGHQAHRHALKNLARSCCFISRSEALAHAQEFEADDYAAARGHGPALASALRRLSVHPFDLLRARRLTDNE